MFHMLGGLFALAIGAHVTLWVVASVLFPLFLIWMLIDAILRDEREYPGGAQNARLLWVLLMAFVNPVAIVYFFVVFLKIKRGSLVSATA